MNTSGSAVAELMRVAWRTCGRPRGETRRQSRRSSTRSGKSVAGALSTITEQREGILAAIHHGLSNARVEAINTQIRLIARRAFGFHSPEALIAPAMLSLGGLCPSLPGRVTLT